MKKLNVNLSQPSKVELDSLLKNYYEEKLIEAEKQSLLLTKKYPKNQIAWRVLGATLKKKKKFLESLLVTKESIKLEPENSELYNILGDTELLIGKLEEAIASFKKAISLNPNFIEAYNNVGVAMQSLGKLEEAEKNYRKVIELNPNFPMAHFNLGKTLKDQRKLEEAIASFKKAISLNPNFIEAYNNVGVAMQSLGKLDEAFVAFTRAIEINPKFHEAVYNLLVLLTNYKPPKKYSNSIIETDREIRKFNLKNNNSSIISDSKIIDLIHHSTAIMKKNNLNLRINENQIYKRNSINLNCGRHKKIFNEFDIIPKFCFDCYKVQVEPESIIELIKLLVVFDQIYLTKNNSRKCFVEMRPEISGFYKGLIFCSSLEEAYQIANDLEKILKKKIRPNLKAIVKRGCSEYGVKFSEYKLINKSGPQKMNYQKNWKIIEENFDSKNSKKYNESLNPTLDGLNFHDFLVIQNWIDYAKGINDQNLNEFKHYKIFSREVYTAAKKRKEELIN